MLPYIQNLNKKHEYARKLQNNNEEISYSINYGNRGYYRKANGEVIHSADYKYGKGKNPLDLRSNENSHLFEPKRELGIKVNKRADEYQLSREYNRGPNPLISKADPRDLSLNRKPRRRSRNMDKQYTPQIIRKNERLTSGRNKINLDPIKPHRRIRQPSNRPIYVYKRPEWWG